MSQSVIEISSGYYRSTHSESGETKTNGWYSSLLSIALRYNYSADEYGSARVEALTDPTQLGNAEFTWELENNLNEYIKITADAENNATATVTNEIISKMTITVVVTAVDPNTNVKGTASKKITVEGKIYPGKIAEGISVSGVAYEYGSGITTPTTKVGSANAITTSATTETTWKLEAKISTSNSVNAVSDCDITYIWSIYSNKTTSGVLKGSIKVDGISYTDTSGYLKEITFETKSYAIETTLTQYAIDNKQNYQVRLKIRYTYTLDDQTKTDEYPIKNNKVSYIAFQFKKAS